MAVITMIVSVALFSMKTLSKPSVDLRKQLDISKTRSPHDEKFIDSMQAVMNRLSRIDLKDVASTPLGVKPIPGQIAASVDEVAEDIDDYKSSRVFIFPKTTPSSEMKLQGSKVLRFKLSSGLLGKGSLQMAKLSLFVDGLATRAGSQRSVISALKREGSKSIVVGSTDVLDRGWAAINLFNLIKRIMEQQLKKSDQTFDIQIECEKCGDRFRVPVDKLLEPYLELEFRKPSPLKRKKRSADCTSVNATCCRDSVDVDLDTLGFDQVIFPRQFKAYFCRGECISDKENELANSIQSAIHLAPRQGSCAPKRTRPLSLLYVSDGTIFQTKIQDFIVMECACT